LLTFLHQGKKVSGVWGQSPVMFGRLPSEEIKENQIEILIENQKQKNMVFYQQKNMAHVDNYL